ncbi:MAG: phosphate ABC transporter ATP-binding protein [Aquisalimonadaceae bacterium]
MNDLNTPNGLLPLELDRVGFRHGGAVLLDNVSLRLPPGGKTVVMGPNGAGKSLLMRLCHGLIAPTSGRIHWSGPAARDSESIRRRQAMVFQRPVMLRRSALANITHALALRDVPRKHRKAQALEALERFGLTALAVRSARVLSGGEQQRLALARAWALHPEILFLDEPTSALDPAATYAVEDAIRTFESNGTRIVMTTHDVGQARRLADEVLFLSGGRLLEHTPAEAFFRQPESRQAAAFIRGELVW